MTTLADLTTLRVGGPATRLVVAHDSDELLAAVVDVDARSERLLLLAGGSNLVVADAGFDGTVVHVARPEGGGIALQGADYCGGADLTAQAGAVWDELVALAVDQGFAGVEALSGIPGSVGATPVQNVGAYGSEVSDTVATVQLYDRTERRTRTLATRDLEFGYRDSLLKLTAHDGPGGTDRYVVLRVGFQLPVADRSAPVRYAELARVLGVEVGAREPLAQVRRAVLALRAGKGMVLQESDRDTWSVGSFFTNPVVAESSLVGSLQDAPRWAVGDGLVKLPAAWLIEHAGIGRGHGMPGPAAVSTKHTLALTNRGGASAEDVVRLAREVRDAVEGAFGVRLEAEPRLVGLTL